MPSVKRSANPEIQAEIDKGREVKSLKEIVGPHWLDYFRSKSQYTVLMGAKGSGKTFTVCIWHIVNMMAHPGANTLVVRRFGSDIQASVFNSFLKAINLLGCGEAWEVRLKPLMLIYRRSKTESQVIMFRGLDDATKAAGVDVPSGALCWLWVEEAYQITSEEEFIKLDMSMRGELPPGLFPRITVTFNPWSDKHWLKKRFFDVDDPRYFTKTSTYHDNDHLSKEDIAKYEALRKTNPAQARIVCDGQWGVSEGLIYTNWHEEEFDYREILNMPGIRKVFGLDFGYKASYSALSCILVDVPKRKMWIFDELYDNTLTNDLLAKAITEMGYSTEHIIADSANPLSIDELKVGLKVEVKPAVYDPETGIELQPAVDYRYSLPNIRPAFKGNDSIANGIQRCQQFEIIVHKNCVNHIKELSTYAWVYDKDGKNTEKPTDEDNHAMDAMRMGMEGVFFVSGSRVTDATVDGPGMFRPAKERIAPKHRRVFST